MTKQEMLASLEAQIRKDIPRLIELREGCLLMKNEKHDNVLKRGEVVKISCLWNDIIQVSPIGEPLSRNYVECQIKDLFEVIGHEIMLNDVLEWLNYTIYKKHISIGGLENTEMVKHFYIKGDDGSIIFEILDLKNPDLGLDTIRYGVWDLSSIYLKDQQERLIKFLYNLKKK
ncbi:hypothetical protein ACILD7_02375 [Capnocytophaga canimorsus]|uniref:hypothetical protein n=1 Tax=Capnocytophaga canimorsus TaxID=28188 RepID=UPI0037D31FAA